MLINYEIRMTNLKKRKITIVGCGIAGIFCAIIFAKKGYQIEIYEKFKKHDICDIASKRSYNLVLFGYAIEILKKTGLWNDIKPFLLSLEGSITHLPNGIKPIKALTDQQKLPYYTVIRSKLVEILLKKASEDSSISFYFETALLSIDKKNKTILIQNLKTKHISSIASDVVIGADGIHSVVRSFMQQGQHSNHSQEYAPWVYKQFILSPQMVEKLSLGKKLVHVWPNKKTFIITHPDDKNALYALLVYP
jgi:kynurenine 3-monooxygenase